jgi:hypothetical protein
MSVQPGRKNKLFFNNKANTASAGSGTHTAPAWVEIARVGDVARTGAKNQTEVNMRASDTTIVVYGNRSREITLTYYKKKGTADSVFDVLNDSFENDTILDLAMMEGPINVDGQLGVRGPFTVAQMDKSEPIDGVDTYDITMQFADEEISSGVPFLFIPEFVIEIP